MPSLPYEQAKCLNSHIHQVIRPEFPQIIEFQRYPVAKLITGAFTLIQC
jgi:hypothetical protein